MPRPKDEKHHADIPDEELYLFKFYLSTAKSEGPFRIIRRIGVDELLIIRDSVSKDGITGYLIVEVLSGMDRGNSFRIPWEVEIEVSYRADYERCKNTLRDSFPIERLRLNDQTNPNS